MGNCSKNSPKKQMVNLLVNNPNKQATIEKQRYCTCLTIHWQKSKNPRSQDECLYEDHKCICYYKHDFGRNTTNPNLQCLSKKHQCVCYLTYQRIDNKLRVDVKCLSTMYHQCICYWVNTHESVSGEQLHCLSQNVHKCSCSFKYENCLIAKNQIGHKCICMQDWIKCLHQEHFHYCSCNGGNECCKSRDHSCVCKSGKFSCKAKSRHKCICLEQQNDMCLEPFHTRDRPIKYQNGRQWHIKCGICWEYKVQSIYCKQCGALICSDCSSKLKHCQRCTHPIQ